MSGVHGHVLGHLVRRGAEHFSTVQQAYVEQLQHDAKLYEESGSKDFKFQEMIPIIVTAVIMFFMIASVKYSIGEVVASLTMIESQTSTAIIEDKPPAYADEPDAPLEKEGLLPAEAAADVEVTLIKNKPVTAKITTAIGHLQRVGGFGARWRGARFSILYHVLHSGATNIVSNIIARHNPIVRSLVYVIMSIMFARFHVLWTHSMIAYPSAKPFWKRFVSRKDLRLVIMPTVVFAAAQQATFLLPMAVAGIVGMPDTDRLVRNAHDGQECGQIAVALLRLLAVPATALIVAFAVLLPASVTLTRIEALLLPEDQDTIVPFDRQAIVADIDLSKCGGARQLFVSAWRSFDRASRWRLIKLYIKLALIQFTIVVSGIHIMLAELYVISGESLALFLKSASAQINLAAIEAQNRQ